MSKKVMIVDDDVNTVKFLSLLLSENGYEPYSAYDGREGLEKLKETQVDLLVLDVMMPKKTGFVLFKQMKKDDQLKDIPVLMLTGVAASLADIDSEAEDTFARPYDALRESLRKAIQEMREDGEVKPEMFVDKPVDPEAFVEKIRQLIGE
jgi:two-component system alkaline phosphatase synthesis response regulator PhoP